MKYLWGWGTALSPPFFWSPDVRYEYASYAGAWHYNAADTKEQRGEVTRECERGARGIRQVRRGAGEKVREGGGGGRMSGDRRALGTPCPQKASEEVEGEARMRGKDEQCGVARKEVSKPFEIG